MSIIDIPLGRRIYLVEIVALNSATNIEETLYFSNSAFITNPSDSPPNQLYEDRVSNALEFGRDMFSLGAIGGKATPGSGYIELNNLDRGLDKLYSDFIILGRPLTIKHGTEEDSFDQFTIVLQGISDQIEFTESFLTIQIKDNQELLENLISTNQYADTGTFATFNESLHGKPLPICYGECYNISPQYIGKVEFGGFVTDLTFQIHDGAIEEVTNVYSNGVLISPGDITTDLPNGQFTINIASISPFVITADVKGSTTGSYTNKIPDIIERILTQKAPNIVQVASKFTDLNTDSNFLGTPIASTAISGIYIKEGGTIGDSIDELCNSIGAFYGFDRLGKFDIGLFGEPDTGSSIGNVTDAEILKITRLPVALLSYQHDVGYKKNFTVLDEGSIAESVIDEEPDLHVFLKEEFRTASADIFEGGILKSDNVTVEPYASPTTHFSIIDRYPTSIVAEQINSLMISSTEATLEARRRWRLYNNYPGGLIQRDRFEVVLKTQPFQLQLNDVVQIISNRFNLDAGKFFKIVSFKESAFINEVTIEVWG